MAGALIVTAEIEAGDFAWIDRLRRMHYPPERNLVPAHLTIFHALPPSAEKEVRGRLSRMAHGTAPVARIEGLIDLGGGVAFRIVSADLDRVRGELARDLHGLLGAQDGSGWRPHVTIQNKVPPKVARALRKSLEHRLETLILGISGLGLYRYLDGPWERIAVYPFR